MEFSPAKILKYLLRLPLFTRIILGLIILMWILELQSAWNVPAWGGLVPKEVGFGTSMDTPTLHTAHLWDHIGKLY